MSRERGERGARAKKRDSRLPYFVCARSFGEVFKGVFRGTDVAIKTLKVVNEENLGRFRGEVLMMHALHHTNIVFLVGVSWDENLIGLLMELSDVGPLSSVMASEKAAKFEWQDPILK